MALRSRGGVAALAVAMILVQLFDAMIGFRLNDPGRAYGPMVFSAINFGLLLCGIQHLRHLGRQILHRPKGSTSDVKTSEQPGRSCFILARRDTSWTQRQK
jgi:hypothetical protein